VYLPYPRIGPDGYRPNAKECLTFFFKLYSPPRCRLCLDATSEFADISVGDPWFKGWEADDRLRSGYSLIIARTQRGLDLLERAGADGALTLEPFPNEKAELSHAPMVRTKRVRALRNIDKRRKRGLPVPEYGFTDEYESVRSVKAAVHCATYFAADSPVLRRAIFRLLLSRFGRLIVGALFFRRRVIQRLWEKHSRRFP
jgi:coenzyme F420 hydrogenase subunit beta